MLPRQGRHEFFGAYPESLRPVTDATNVGGIAGDTRSLSVEALQAGPLAITASAVRSRQLRDRGLGRSSIVGVQRVAGGSVTVLGLPAGTTALRRRLGYVTQSASVPVERITG